MMEAEERALRALKETMTQAEEAQETSSKPEFMTALLEEIREYHEALKEVSELARARGDPWENMLEIREIVNDVLTSGKTPEELLGLGKVGRG